MRDGLVWIRDGLFPTLGFQQETSLGRLWRFSLVTVFNILGENGAGAQKGNCSTLYSVPGSIEGRLMVMLGGAKILGAVLQGGI